MVRLIPRIANFLRSKAYQKSLERVRSRKPSQAFRPPRLPGVKKRPPLPNLDPSGRKKSILLDPLNPIVHKGEYEDVYQLPPLLPSNARAKTEATEERRVMNEDDLRIMADPYLRMLNSPVRHCIVSKMYLPSDLLIHIGLVKATDPSSSKTQLYITPDRMDNPKYAPRMSGKGWWVSCWSEAFEALMKVPAITYRNVKQKVVMHDLLKEQVFQGLTRRLIQELELLRDRMKAVPLSMKDDDSTIVRRLTRREWLELKETGKFSVPGATAVIVAPPVPPTARKISDPRPTKNEYPLSYFCEDASSSSSSITTLPKIPVYNSFSIFQSPKERHELHLLLNQLLGVERNQRAEQRRANKALKAVERQSGSINPLDKDSDAYVFRSTKSTLLRADVVPVFTALWRIRLWKGFGWDRGKYGGWESDNLSQFEEPGQVASSQRTEN